MDDNMSRLPELIANASEAVVNTLAKVGIELPLVISQLFLFVPVLVVLLPLLHWLWSNWQQMEQYVLLVWLTVSTALGLIALGIFIGVLGQFLLPYQVLGKVKTTNLEDVRVQLIGFRDQPISIGSGRIDSKSGEFVLDYKPCLDGPARRLRITAPGCADRDFPISYPESHSGNLSEVEYSCEKR